MRNYQYPESYPVGLGFGVHAKRHKPNVGKCRAMVILDFRQGQTHQCTRSLGFGPEGLLCKLHWKSWFNKDWDEALFSSWLDREKYHCPTCGQEVSKPIAENVKS